MISGITPMKYMEFQNCRQRLADFFGDGPGSPIKPAIDEAVVAVFASFYRCRFGPAVGSTAANVKTGQVATRYYDAEMKMFRWLVVESPERADIRAERMDNLPAKGEGWKVTERSWEELVYK